jgi:subtilase family serine protease
MMPKMLFCLAASALVASAAVAAEAGPPAARLAQDRGPADPSQKINLTVQLTMRNADEFDKTLAALYRPGSATFHHWLTDADLQRFAPTPAQRAAVRTALEQHGLTVLSTDKYGFSFRVRGTLGDAARAFNTEIHDFDRDGESFRAPIREARLSGVAGACVSAVGGLESHRVRPMLSHALDPRTGRPFAAIPVSKVEKSNSLTSLITDQALTATQTFTYSTPGESLPTATYSGIIYATNPDLAVDFTSAQLQAAYGLTAAYKKGLDGTGQTIVLLEGYGYPTIEADANEFSKLNGLPALTSANFSIVYPEGKPKNPNAGELTGWDGEIALDVQWSHSIAPGANIVVVATNGQDNEDFETSMNYIIDHKLGYVVSDSWEEDTDAFAGPDEQKSYENILKIAAAKGVSFQFSTGDGGDGGLGTPVGAAGVPSVEPHAVAVGGTAVLNKIGTSAFESVGWGDSFATLDADGPLDPPTNFFYAGGGGGESIYWPKPSWQSALTGTGRQTPDISALADPYTGVPIVLTENKQQDIYIGVGGTSLASPIFTAIWAIADQKAGHPLGQASPTIAALTKGVTDVLPVSNGDDVKGSVTDSGGTKKYSTDALFAGLIPDEQDFIAGLWNPDATDAYGIAFALDSSLNVTKGWDNATGYGTPDGLTFIDAAAALK